MGAVGSVAGRPGKRVCIEGMLVSDKPEFFSEWRARLLRGGNFGKMLLRVGPDTV